jgi:trans-aconitate 2-methyltransferase
VASGDWDPQQYARFAEERSQPFYDLAALVERRPAMRVVDLGCGGGALTAWLHRELAAAETVGVDRSEAMLAGAAQHAGDGLRFEAGDIRDWAPAQPVDLVFSNAALQWVEGHEALWPRLASFLAPGGQLAVQMPMNDDHTSHVVARRMAGEEPFRSWLDGYERSFPTLAPQRYAEVLYELGFEPRHVRMQVYEHLLPNTQAVVEWVKGSLLSAYRDRLPAEHYAAFLAEYERRLLAELGEHEPFYYPYKRVLMWGQLPEA